MVLWKAYIDLNWDGDFTDTNEEISAYVVSMRWFLGMKPYERMCRLSWAEIVVNNSSGRFSPEQGLVSFLVGKRVKIDSYASSTTRRHFTGFIDRIEPTAGDGSERLCTIYAVAADRELYEQTITIVPQLNARSDVVVDAIVDAAYLKRGVYGAILDDPVYGLLDSTAYLAADVDSVLDVGDTTFTYVGDRWAGGVTPYEALREIVLSEGGQFFVNRSGSMIFNARSYRLTLTTLSATYDETMTRMKYAHGVVKNIVRTTVVGRYAGSADTVLWQSDSSQRVPVGNPREITVRFRDSNKRPCGATVVLVPIQGVDYTANTASDGTGLDVTSYVTVGLLRSDFSTATLSVYNGYGATVYLRPGMRVKGTPLYQDDPLTLEVRDYRSMTYYGVRSHTLELPVLDSVDEADSAVRLELSRRRLPAGVVENVTLSGLESALAVTIGARVSLVDSQLGHDAEYFINGETWSVTSVGAGYEVTWDVEPAGTAVYILNSMYLDINAFLAY